MMSIQIMRIILIGPILAVLLTGCRTVSKEQVPARRVQSLSTSLVAFVSSPKDGIYALPAEDPVPTDDFLYNVLVVSNSAIWLSRSQDNRVSTNKMDMAAYKAVFPADSDLTALQGPKTEKEMQDLFGQATYEGRDIIPYFGIESFNTKHASYEWFTVLPTSEIMFMTLTVNYDKTENGLWTATSMQWYKNGGKRLVSN